MKKIKKFLSLIISGTLLISSCNSVQAKKIPKKPDPPQITSPTEDIPKDNVNTKKSDNNENINKKSFLSTHSGFFTYFKFYFLSSIIIKALKHMDSGQRNKIEKIIF